MSIPRGLRLFLSILLVIRLSWAELEQAPDEGRQPKPTEADEKPKNKLARGWGDNIPWMELEAGIEKAKEENKPLMLIIHKTWCGACQTLKGKFAKAKMIAELAKNFIMVNAEDDEEPWEEDYQPDGGKYIPRIFFLSPEGQVLKDVINPKDEYKQYPYYYSNPAPIITVMQSVLKKYGLPTPGDAGSDEKKSIKAEKEATTKEDVKKEKSKKDDETKDDPAKPDDVKKGECPKMAKAKKEAAEKEKKEKKDKELPRKGKKGSGEAPGDDDQPKPPAHKPPKKEL